MRDSISLRSPAEGVVAEAALLPGVASLVEKMEAPAAAIRARGLAGSSGALLLAAAAPRTGSSLVLCPDPDHAAAVASDLTLFCGDPAMVLCFPAFAGRDADHRSREAAVLAGRLCALERLEAGDGPRFLVASVAAALDCVPSQARLREAMLRFAPGMRVDPDRLAADLEAARFARVSRVEGPGEWARRGGVVDVFPLGGGGPVRLEWFDDVVESVRRFDPATQRSFGEERRGLLLNLLPREELAAAATGALLDHLPASSWVVLHEAERIEEWVERVAGHTSGIAARWLSFLRECAGRRRLDLSPSAPRGAADADAPMPSHPVVEAARDPGRLAEVLTRRLAADGTATVFAGNAAEASRFRTLLDGSALPRTVRDHVEVCEGRLHGPFRVPSLGRALLSLDALFERRPVRRPGPLAEAMAGAAKPVDLADLRPGDHVVHLGHGLAIFRGTEREDRPGGVRESLVLEFRDAVRVLVPAGRADLVHRYVGTREGRPRLSKYGGRDWKRRTEEVEKAVDDVAADLLEMQALRRLRAGIAHPPDGTEQAEFEASFPWEDTPDQSEACVAVKADMEAARPMDRLLCGDVGFGKTEIAVRAAFKCVLGGRQAAVLVPTTLLAEQHGQTFRERFAGWPLTVEVLSRFRTKGEQKAVIERAAAGGVDVLVGTHRMLQPDVTFRDLGLVVVDEEQRFGVAHKQRLRSLRATVDVLTMTATPIPRTLHMALLGLRDTSNLETPPEGRQSIETEVRTFAPGWLREVLLREMDRGGRAYFVHDRVASILSVAAMLQRVVPEARIGIAHGQMHEDEIEDAMARFTNGEIDVLVATSIIENGLDIPAANTVVIDRAHRFGLADLHQLRGRVGRGAHRAYCYLVVPDGPVATDAERRVRAIEEYAGLGEGYNIAVRDLEIRGAGNLLGVQQSGHIASVGYEMYCALLEEAVHRRRGEPTAERADCTVDLPVPASLPVSLMPDMRERIGVYRLLAQCTTLDQVDGAAADLRDRYGAPPPEVRLLLDLARVRVRAAGAGADLVFRPPEKDRVAFRASDPKRLAAALAHLGSRVRRVDEHEFHLLLPADLPPSELLRRVESALRPPRPAGGAPKAGAPVSAAAAAGPAPDRRNRGRRPFRAPGSRGRG